MTSISMHNLIIRQLGKNGPHVPALGLGLMGLSHGVYGSVADDKSRFAILNKACELGATFWDSSDLYGDSEELIGKWFKYTGKRKEIFLATKFGFVKNKLPLEVNSSGKYVKEACEESLKALGVDCIDLYYMHHANPATPIEETMRALKELQDKGKIKYIGLSAISSTTLRRACTIAHVDAVQVDYSPTVLDIESSKGTDLLATCREVGAAVVCAMPLGRGLLTSSFASGDALGDETDVRLKMFPRFLGENREKNVQAARSWQALAERQGCTAAQLALAWLVAQGDDIFLIPGTKREKYLVENCGAADVKLSKDDVQEIREFIEAMEIAGSAVPPALEGYNYRDTVEEKAQEDALILGGVAAK